VGRDVKEWGGRGLDPKQIQRKPRSRQGKSNPHSKTQAKVCDGTFREKHATVPEEDEGRREEGYV